MLYILAVGNFLNGTTNRKDSYGFKLSEIDKILEIKGFESKKSLMMYIVK